MFRFVETFHHFFAFCLSVFWILLVKHHQYENYKPEETKKIQAAKIFQAGDYWVLVISDNADEISDEITDMIN